MLVQPELFQALPSQPTNSLLQLLWLLIMLNFKLGKLLHQLSFLRLGQLQLLPLTVSTDSYTSSPVLLSQLTVKFFLIILIHHELFGEFSGFQLRFRLLPIPQWL